MSHSGRSSETPQSLHPSSRHFFCLFVLTYLPSHDLPPSFVLKINAFASGRVLCNRDKFLFISVAPLVRGLVCTSHALRFDCHCIATSGIFFISPMHQVCAGGQEIVRLSYKKAVPKWRHIPDVISYGGILQGILENSTVYAAVVELPFGPIGGLHSVESHWWPSAFDHHFVTDKPGLLWPFWVLRFTSLNLRHSLPWYVASLNFFLPVLIVSCTVFTTGSSESSKMESNNFHFNNDQIH